MTDVDLAAFAVDQPDPVPLTRGRALPAFPVGALPGWAAEMVRAVANFTQTPLDLAGTVALGVLSACAGGRAVVEARPGWREPLNCYVVVASAPGTRKSPVFAAMTRPLLDAERELTDATRPAIVEAETTRTVAQRAADQAKAAAARADGKDRDARTADAVAAAMAAEAVTVPVLPRLFADNVTPEAAGSLLAQQGGRLAILSAEGGLFDLLAGRYSNGVPDLDVWLKGHAGDALRVDRKGREPEYVPSPALTVCLAVQPAVLTAAGRNDVFAGRGLLARFLYALPANNVGRRLVGVEPVPESVAALYAAAVDALARSLAEWTDPAVLTLTAEAAAVLLASERAVEPRLAPEGDLGGIAEWASKLVGGTVRIAGLLHLGGDPHAGWTRPVDADTMRAAVKLADYFIAHALVTFDLMGADTGLDDARAVLEHLRRHRVEEFSVRSLFTALPRTRFPKTPVLVDALDLLEDRGWITARPAPEHAGPGRPPSPRYVCHPLVCAALSAQSAEPPREQLSADCADNADGLRGSA